MGRHSFRGDTLAESEQMARGTFQAMVRDAVGRIGLWNGSHYLTEPPHRLQHLVPPPGQQRQIPGA